MSSSISYYSEQNDGHVISVLVCVMLLIYFIYTIFNRILYAYKIIFNINYIFIILYIQYLSVQPISTNELIQVPCTV